MLSSWLAVLLLGAGGVALAVAALLTLAPTTLGEYRRRNRKGRKGGGEDYRR